MCTFGEPKRGHLRVPVFETPLKFNEKTSKRGKKGRNMWERGRKGRNFGWSCGGGVREKTKEKKKKKKKKKEKRKKRGVQKTNKDDSSTVPHLCLPVLNPDLGVGPQFGGENVVDVHHSPWLAHHVQIVQKGEEPLCWEKTAGHSFQCPVLAQGK